MVGEEILVIRWAYEDPNPTVVEKNKREAENIFLSAVMKKERKVEEHSLDVSYAVQLDEVE